MSQHIDPQSTGIPSSRHYHRGKFGRIFPSLPPCHRDQNVAIADLEKIAKLVVKGSQENVDLPAGYTYLGQFIGHDMSFDPTSVNERSIDPESLWNYRTPALDLDSIYGGGPSITPYLYDQAPEKGKGRTHFLLTTKKLSDKIKFCDVPRMATIQKTAIIADPRNDDNIIVSRIHSAFLSFHNKLADKVKENAITSGLEMSSDDIFQAAQQLARWHYQWVILYDYLPRIIDLSEHQDIPYKLSDTDNTFQKTFCAREQIKWMTKDENRRRYYTWKHEPFIPLEFSVAAFRFGHSQVRSSYVFNSKSGPKNLFPVAYFKSKKHFARVHLSSFFPEGREKKVTSNRIDPFIAAAMTKLPGGTPEINLPLRSLLRGLQHNIPSGQSIAKAMGLKPLIIRKNPPLYNQLPKKSDDLASLEKFWQEFPEQLKENTPLWYYILYEAFEKNLGLRLGPVCSRIVAEVFVGLIQGDNTSFLSQDPNWSPKDELGNPNPDFSMADLLKLAEVYEKNE